MSSDYVNRGRIPTTQQQKTKQPKKKPNNLIKIWAKDMNFSEEDNKWTVNTWKDDQQEKSLGKCQSNPQWDTVLYPSGCLLLKSKLTSVREDANKLES